MIERLRRAFNAGWTQRSTSRTRRGSRGHGATHPLPRLRDAGVPAAELRDAMLKGAFELFDELLAPAALERSKAAVPKEFDVPGGDEGHPLFAVSTSRSPRGRPRGAALIELQGFPSLFGFQLSRGRLCREMVPDEPLEFLLSGLDEAGYRRIVGEAITAECRSRTSCCSTSSREAGDLPGLRRDERLWGVRSVCPTKVEKRGRELWYERDGRKTRILRIYNRMIVDELVDKGTELPFRLTDDLDVQWAGHPNWFFRWSKHALPRLRHPLVPERGCCPDFDRLARRPRALGAEAALLLLRLGRERGPDSADLAAVPEAERSRTLLMRKVDYAPVIEAPDGARSRVEVRVMCVWRTAGRCR
jgi:hypothetical protein